MQLHEIQPKTKTNSSKRVGRGGRRGKTSGKGHKGQKARAGGTPRPAIRDIISKIPKLRGHGKNRARTINSGKVQTAVVNLSDLEQFKAGTTITPEVLLEAGLISRVGGSIPPVKILGGGELSKKLSFENVSFSESARAHVEGK